jgi:hypothetical protein
MQFAWLLLDGRLCLYAGGNELAAVISAASLALADARLEMRDLVAACSVVRIPVRVHADQVSVPRLPASTPSCSVSAWLAHVLVIFEGTCACVEKLDRC